LLKSLTGVLCICFAMSAFAKLGETVPELMKRFGKSYTVEEAQIGKMYKFRSANVSVDVVVANGRSIRETYLSDHPLSKSGEPPNDIVRAVLRTNVPKARWIEIEAAPLQADYALRSSDGQYTAILNYTGPQPENTIWTMTVGLAKTLQTVTATGPLETPSPSPHVPRSSSETPPGMEPSPSAVSEYETGLRYYRGEGVERNYPQAVKWFRKAAEQNHAAAQRMLAACYYFGQGMPKNYVEAVKWLRKASEKSDAPAQGMLGFCYYFGQGVSKNYTEAVK
jgi:tetratricopeptide (TPR) repeat protein